jgi:hypothetical protein
LPGEQGLQGEQGVQGEQGPAGPEGPAGAEGPQGPAGNDGEAGADALWNFTGAWADGIDYDAGDVVEFNGSSYYAPTGIFSSYSPPNNGWLLVSSKGDAGEPGVAGADGINGADGAQGPAGADGTNGIDGQDGAQGPEGPAGPQGEQGIQGESGLLTVASPLVYEVETKSLSLDEDALLLNERFESHERLNIMGAY